MSRPVVKTVTLRSLKPYLVLYRIFGLIPVRFQSFDDGVSAWEWSWTINKRPGWKIYTLIALILVTLSLTDTITGVLSNLPNVSFASEEAIHLLEAVNNSSFCINVFAIFIFCYVYLGKRLCRLIQKMIDCERDLININSQLREDRVFIHCWIALAVGIGVTLLHESIYAVRHWEDVTNSYNSSDSYHHINFMKIRTTCRLIVAHFAAWAWPFADYSIIQLSIIFSFYQKTLRQKMDCWSLMDLKTKEKFRQFYWTVQTLIKDADEIFSPAILIGSLSTVTHLILQLNIGLRISYSETSVALQHYSDILKTTALSSIYLALRFVASSLYAEKIYEEKRKCLRNLHDQTREDVWTPDLDLLITKRFVQQLMVPIGFTGCGFFRLGKRFVITMCGTILTYEVVLFDMTIIKLIIKP